MRISSHLNDQAKVLGKAYDRAPYLRQWTTRLKEPELRRVLGFLPEAEMNLAMSIALGTCGPRAPFTLPMVGCKFNHFSSKEELLERLVANPKALADYLKNKAKDVFVGAVSRAQDWKEGDKVFGHELIYQDSFAVYKHGEQDKPRFVTNLSKQCRVKLPFPEDLAVANPQHRDYLVRLWNRCDGRPSSNLLLECYQTTMGYQTLRDQVAKIMFASPSDLFVQNDWKTFFSQLVGPRWNRYLALEYVFYWDDSGELVWKAFIKMAVIQGEDASCFRANTFNVLFFKALALSQPVSRFRPSNPISAGDLGLVPSFTPKISTRKRNPIELAHQDHIPFYAFRTGDILVNFTVFCDDSSAPDENAFDLKEELVKAAKRIGLLHSEISVIKGAFVFCGTLFSKPANTISFPPKKWKKVWTLQIQCELKGQESGHTILSWIGSLVHLSEIFPQHRVNAVFLSGWAGYLGRKTKDPVPARLRRKWKLALDQIYKIPAQILKMGREILLNVQNAATPAINFLLDELDTFQTELGSLRETKFFKFISEMQFCENFFTKITACAAELKIEAMVASCDSTPKGGVGFVSHSYGPFIPLKDRPAGWKRRVIGSYWHLDWTDCLEFLLRFGTSSPAFELAGKAIALAHPWIREVIDNFRRAETSGARPVVVILGDNSGAVNSVNSYLAKASYTGPARLFHSRAEEYGIKVFSLHMAGAIIPADVPSRRDTGWVPKLHRYLRALGLKPDRLTDCFPPPSLWPQDCAQMVSLQDEYTLVSIFFTTFRARNLPLS